MNSCKIDYIANFKYFMQNEHLKNCNQSVVTSTLPSLIEQFQQMQAPEQPPKNLHHDYEDEESADEQEVKPTLAHRLFHRKKGKDKSIEMKQLEV
jgi:hypothetical protein